MLWQILTVLYFLLSAASHEPLLRFLGPAFAPSTLHDWIGGTIITVTTGLTLVSGLSYFWKNRQLFADA
jgi:CDP-diacylglycerol--glycerol-3-phosphate 3-phosphatidyltransferase